MMFECHRASKRILIYSGLVVHACTAGTQDHIARLQERLAAAEAQAAAAEAALATLHVQVAPSSAGHGALDAQLVHSAM
jgi:hypothetical protein